ncbi:Sodium channel protein Nach [Trachymyrmex septentrionalis]|uniref:Sodium channel protein Nach n=1 Tax=Trachymyrmex septentrionalis TaxID=34720 RepID=A0A195EVN0_9HYME|nr:Sodium channel protein Nach [Trachymyrmex septentrionalis]
MKPNWNKKSKFDNVKHRYRKCLAYVKKHLDWFSVYCDNTNLHGFRYISMDGSSIIESILWFLVCMLSIVFCVIWMLRLWANYSNNPIVTTIYTSNPIWDVSFPAITICNNNKVYRPHADFIAKNLYMDGFTTNDSDKFFSSLIKLIRPNKISSDNAIARQVLDRLDMTVEALMKQLMQPCSALLLRCAWIGKVYDCSKIFKTVKSKEGFCCAFNYHYYVEHMSKVKPFNSTDFNNTSEDDLPGVHTIVKAPGSGRDVGLAVALNIEPDMYKATSRPFIGASVIIHDPIDFPDIGAHITAVPVGHVLAISITGTSIRGMESLRAIPLEKRLCYFDNEMPGEIRYSHQSCISDCIANHIHHMCGCLPFYYPESHKGMKTCYLSDINCLLSIRKSIPHHANAGTCKKCLPQCTDMLYTINPEYVKMDDVGFDFDLTHGFNINNTSFVYVFFDDVSYVEYRKESTISWDSLLASFGGIFGLCLGGSVLSVIELVYLLARQLFRRQKKMLKWQEQSRMKLPPASEVFLSIPAKEKVRLRKLRNRQESDDKRTFVRYQPVLHQRKTTNLDNIYYIKHVRF